MSAIGPGVGDSGVAVSGSLVRSSGLGNLNFPNVVDVSNNTIFDIGIFGKQVSAVFISASGNVTVSDNRISGSPSSGVKINDGFVGGHKIIWNHISNTTREVSDMGTINLHNRDRFYTPWDSPVWNKKVNPPGSGWPAPQYPVPVPRGPVDVDTVYPIRISNNLLESRGRSGVANDHGAEWWGKQAAISCVDVDDGPVKYDIVENVCITDNTAGFKVGHVVDRIHVANNIVLAHNVTASADAFEVPKQPFNNSNSFTRNILVNMDMDSAGSLDDGNIDGRGRSARSSSSSSPSGAVEVGSGTRKPPSWKFSSYCVNNATLVPPPSIVDWNMYYALNNATKLGFCRSYQYWTKGLGLDQHSLFHVDPQLENIQPGSTGYPFSVRVGEASPAIANLGFLEFKYGPREFV